MPSISRQIKNDTPLARRIVQEVQYRVRLSDRKLSERKRKWKQAEETALAYMPEREVDAIRRTAREGGLPQYTTIQIPYSYAVLMSAHTYLTSVFMGRSPIFQYAGRHGESEQQTQALEALIDYQMLVGRILPALYTWLYDVGKYGCGIVGGYWEDRMEAVTSIQQIPVLDLLGNPTQQMEKKQSTQMLQTYSGNRVYNVQPWDFFWDVRFPLRELQSGEYCGVFRTLSWNEVKRREVDGFYMNLDDVGMSAGVKLDMSDQGSELLDRPDREDWGDYDDKIAGETDRPRRKPHPKIVNFYETYIELIPNEWGLSPSPYPEKWIFTVTSDWKTLIGAQPLGAFHCMFPFHVLCLEPEGYGLLTRGIPEILEPVQQTIDWLINSHFYNVRAVLNNKMVVDPSRVVMKDLLDPLPGGIIRLKPEAYGQDPKLAFSQVSVTDVTQNHLRDLQMMIGVGERTIGVNDQIMGLMQGGGRKTATEVRTSTSFGVNRLKTIAEYFSISGFDPLSQTMVQNTQQYYNEEKKFRLAGNLAQQAGLPFMTVTPETIAGFYNFVPVNGDLPIDRYAQANLWQQLLSQISKMPQIGMQYDLGRIFEWVAQLAGLKNISQFKIQLTPDALLTAQAQQGNVVPMKGSAPPGPNANPNEPGQLPGMGPTG